VKKSTSHIKDTIRLLLAKDIGKGVSALEKYSNFFPDFSNEIILILNRYRNYKKDSLRGYLSHDELGRIRNGIVFSILELLDLADERSEIDIVSESSQNVQSEKAIPAFGALVTTIKTILVVIYGYFQYFKQLRLGLSNDESMFMRVDLSGVGFKSKKKNKIFTIVLYEVTL